MNDSIMTHRGFEGGFDTAETAATASAPRRGFYARFGKRSLDVAIVFLAALPVLTLVLIGAALVALDGGRPFYSQRRIGRNGRTFRMWKLRSMTPDADKVLAAHLAADPAAAREWATYQKLKADPRITRMGRLLRKTSLDELPQLFNVLIGDMSLVGPRPMMVEQADIYPGTCYYALRPGITGNWQVSDRNSSSFADRAAFDSAYLDNLSLREDARILTMTVPAVLRATGH